MSFFKKLGGAIKRIARNKVVQGALNVATGGLSGKVVSVGKQLGAAIKGGKLLKKQNKSVVIPLAKAGSENILPPEIQPLEVRDMTPSTPQRRRSKKRSTSGTSKATKKPKAKAAKGTSKRKPPKGGLDFTAMNKAWKAAGSPGTWKAWTRNKDNFIRKG